MTNMMCGMNSLYGGGEGRRAKVPRIQREIDAEYRAMPFRAGPHKEEAKPCTCFMDLTIGGAPAGRLVFKLDTARTPKTAKNFRGLCTGEFGTGRRLHSLDRSLGPAHVKTLKKATSYLNRQRACALLLLF